MKLAEDWVVVVWGLFNYFEVGCPVSDSAISEAAQRSASSPWAPMHSDHASNLFDKCWKFCRVKAREGPNQGIASLFEQLEFARARSYDRHGLVDLDSLAQHAGDVLPHHASPCFLARQGSCD